MSKIMTVDYYKEGEIIGGVQSLFSQFKEIDKNYKPTSYFSAAQTLGLPAQPNQLGWYFEFFGSQVIQEYIDKYENLFPEDDRVIIKNSIVGTFKKHKSPMISVLQDNNLEGPKRLQEKGLYDPVTYRRFYQGFTYLQQLTFNHSDKIVAVSDHVADSYKKEFGIECEVINNAIDTKAFYPMKNKDELKDKYKIPKDMPICISVTAFHPIKNWHFISQLVKDFPEVFFVLIFKHQLLDQRIKSQNVHIFYNMPRNVMNELYNLGDFAILPSIDEGDNIFVKEAASCGLPLLVTPVGLFWNWWNKKLGYKLEKWDDYNELKEKFELMLDNYKKFNPRTVATQKFSLPTWKKKWKKVIEEVIM